MEDQVWFAMEDRASAVLRQAVAATVARPTREEILAAGAEAVAARVAAVQGEYGDREVFEYCDNHRAAVVGDVAAMAAYAVQREHGCCGSVDIALVVGGVEVLFGFNHGH